MQHEDITSTLEMSSFSTVVGKVCLIDVYFCEHKHGCGSVIFFVVTDGSFQTEFGGVEDIHVTREIICISL